MIPRTDLEALIRAALPDAAVDLEDLTGGEDHWRARIISESFAGLAQLARHRLVYRALGDAMRGPVHALALETLTPAEAS